ncbi:hypothetical protein SEA_PAVLO_101 [Microbacterium phage Pavlo]|nr:hypothetical protein SEA_ROMAN_102 [Microbacterium phage Roman]UVG34157.1 hypothetical protein SEA_PAVLO_101 [Microbacterium phage Pavlo]
MSEASKGNQQIIEAERILTEAVAPLTDAESIAQAQAMLTLALVREQRTANLIAWFSRPGWNPSREAEQLVLDALGLTKEKS